MALSGFIKSLLQTDTVFGSEAKKVTGINDSIIQFYNSNVNASFLVNDTDNTFTFVINNYNTTITTPSWLIRDKYIKFFFFNFDTTQPQFQELDDYEGRLFQIGNVTVDSTAGTLTITFLPDALGTPPFNTSILPNIPSISNFDVRLDGRIFTLIGDPSIAREASNGSTMFNLDNENISPFSDADSSGIARKFASHYHTDVTAEIVVHEKDNAGFDLVRIGLRDRALTQTIVFNETEALRQASLPTPGVTTANTFIEFTSGITTTKVAEYATVGKEVSGNFAFLPDSKPPRGQTPIPVNVAITGFNDVTNILSVANHTVFQVADTIIIDEADGSTDGAAVILSFPSATEIEISIIFTATTPVSGDSISLIHRPGIESNSDGITFRGINYICNLQAASVDATNINWAIDVEPRFGESTIARLALLTLMNILQTDWSDEYTFDRRDDANGNPALYYTGKIPGTADNAEPTPINNGGTGERVFVNAADFRPGRDAEPVEGIRFRTQADLIAVLRVNQLNFTIADPGGVIIIGTDTDDTKTFTVTVPTFDTPVFSNLVPANGLTNVPVNNGLFRTLRRHPDIVFDLDGNAVFSAPFFGVGV